MESLGHTAKAALSLLNASADPELITLEDLGNYEIQNSLISKLEGAIFKVKENKQLNNDQDLQMVAAPDLCRNSDRNHR